MLTGEHKGLPHVVGSYLVLNILFLIFPNPSAECRYAKTSFFKEGEGDIYYLVVYNSLVGRALDTKMSTCGN